jgi:hypothetical protein
MAFPQRSSNARYIHDDEANTDQASNTQAERLDRREEHYK